MPAVVLLAGVIGLVYADPMDRAEVVAVLVGILPPMQGLIETVLTEVTRDAAPVSIVGAVVLIWGTSRFVVAFQDAMARIMGGEQPRGVFTTNVAALVAVVLMVASIPATALIAAVLAVLEAGADSGVVGAIGGVVSLALGSLPVLTTIGAMLLAYRFVPKPAPNWKAVVIPGIAVGLVLTVIARLFVFIAPRLLGSAALLGTLVTVFAALAWLALSFQAILLGAAWIRDRSIRQTPPGARDLQT